MLSMELKGKDIDIGFKATILSRYVCSRGIVLSSTC